MLMSDDGDIPYGENFHDPAVAAAWADAAARLRPWRPLIFERFAAALRESPLPAPRVLELGSGPGFLAEHVLDGCPAIARYTLLDFSDAMLELSRRRLVHHAARTDFVRADFKDEAWPAAAGGPFDFVLSLQAVHELRHKRHAPTLYARARSLLAPAATLLVCDHLPDVAPVPAHRVLYMESDEYLAVLSAAGFTDTTVVWGEHNMALYRARSGGC
jgi:SAM-dependent methyltransferase